MKPEEFGPFLIEQRKKNHMTQGQLAEALHVSIAAVSKWERCKSLPDISKLEDIADALGLTLIEVMECRKTSEGKEKQVHELLSETIQLSNSQHKEKIRKAAVIAATAIAAMVLLLFLGRPFWVEEMCAAGSLDYSVEKGNQSFGFDLQILDHSYAISDVEFTESNEKLVVEVKNVKKSPFYSGSIHKEYTPASKIERIYLYDTVIWDAAISHFFELFEERDMSAMKAIVSNEMQEYFIDTTNGETFFFGLTSASLAGIKEVESEEAEELFEDNGKTSILYDVHFIGNPAPAEYSSWEPNIIDSHFFMRLSFENGCWIISGLTTG